MINAIYQQAQIKQYIIALYSLNYFNCYHYSNLKLTNKPDPIHIIKNHFFIENILF